MKARILALLLSLAGAAAFGQGLVNFFNTPATLFSAGWVGGSTIPTEPGAYYFGLLIAPVGTTDPHQFTFTGVYATNTATAGRLFGGSSRAVTGWPAGESRSFLVAGWSGNLGNVYNPAWLAGYFGGPPWFPDAFGISTIGTGIAGGTDINGLPFPNLNIFGGAPSITMGFSMVLIPEPSVAAVALLAAGFAFARRCASRRKSP